MHKIKLKTVTIWMFAREYPDYRFHITDSIIFTSDRKMLASLFVAGIPFETENDNVLTNLFNSVKNFLIGLGKGRRPVFMDSSYQEKSNHQWRMEF